MFTRILVIVILVAIALWMLRKALGHPRKGSSSTDGADRVDSAKADRSGRTPGSPKDGAPPARPQDLVACSHCGLHLPRDEALWRNAKAYCCSQHVEHSPTNRADHDPM